MRAILTSVSHLERLVCLFTALRAFCARGLVPGGFGPEEVAQSRNGRLFVTTPEVATVSVLLLLLLRAYFFDTIWFTCWVQTHVPTSVLERSSLVRDLSAEM